MQSFKQISSEANWSYRAVYLVLARSCWVGVSCEWWRERRLGGEGVGTTGTGVGVGSGEPRDIRLACSSSDSSARGP